jgi:hypothetical protein
VPRGPDDTQVFLGLRNRPSLERLLTVAGDIRNVLAKLHALRADIGATLEALRRLRH